MGYSMLPSKGCSACRARKIKCDQEPDGCGQCAKAHKECPGYRDLLSLMFRNESDSVAKKVEAREAKIRKNKPKTKRQASSSKGKGPAQMTGRTLSWVTTTSSETHPTGSVASRQQNPNQIMSPLGSGSTYSIPSRVPSPICHSLGCGATVDEQGICFFLQRFVMDTSGFTFSTLQTPLIGSAHMAAGDNSPLILGMKAVGIACLSNVNTPTSYSPQLMTTALQYYATALRLTNDALRSPQDALKDSTLLTIMILGLWEQVTGQTNYSLSAWKNHVTGASALLKLRGKKQFQSPAGLQLFMQVSAMILTSCVQHELHVPQHVMDLRVVAKMYVNTFDIGWRFSEVTAEFANFRANLKDRHPSLSTAKDIIRAALNIDEEMTSIFDMRTLPQEWRYETVYAGPEVDNRIVFAGYYHLYSNIRIARTWSAMRCSRFLLHRIISNLFGKGINSNLKPALFEQGGLGGTRGLQYAGSFSDETEDGLKQWRSSMDVLWELQADILAAVPQLIGYVSSPGGWAVSSPDGDNLMGNEPDSPPRSETLIMTSNVRLSSPSLSLDEDGDIIAPAAPQLASYSATVDPALTSYSSDFSDSESRYSQSTRSRTSDPTIGSSHNLPTLLVGSGGLYVLWPLYVIGMRSVTPESLRTWVITCLKTLGRSQGIMQALMLAGLIEKREQIASWQRKYLKLEEQEINEGLTKGSLGSTGIGIGTQPDGNGLWKYGGEGGGNSTDFITTPESVVEVSNDDDDDDDEKAADLGNSMYKFGIEGLTEVGPIDEYQEMSCLV